MKALLMDGTAGEDTIGRDTRERLVRLLETHGWDVRGLTLREHKIGPCAGDFYCWIKTPGTCQLDDDNRFIAREYVNADLAVLLTPVTFGGYSSTLKRAVDHLIQNISPFFASVNGETHHKKRYAAYPDLLVVGYAEAPEPRHETVFRHLVQRNAVNFFAGRCACAILHGSDPEDNIEATLAAALENLAAGALPEPVTLPAPAEGHGPDRIERAVLLVGSPKTRQSTSLVLGDYLLDLLVGPGTPSETFFLHQTVRSPERMREMAEVIDHAQLVVLTFPLYVDSLPAPVIEVLEKLTELRRSFATSRPAFVGISNCGFPENVHNLTALAICETFAGEAGFTWAGGLPVGSGGGLVGGQPMESGRTARIRKALDIAADALDRGEPIPAAARQPMEKPVIPHWMYRTVGGLGWTIQSRAYGARKKLRDRPYR